MVFLPPPVQVVHSYDVPGSSRFDHDDPLFEAKINNPFGKFFNWIKKFLKNQQNIKITIPSLTFIGLGLALTGGGGIIGAVIVYFFPHSSPVLHREVMYQGNLQRSEKGILFTLPNSDLYTLKPKTNAGINFQALQDGQALVKGNLTPENFVIEVSEIIPLNSPNSLTSPNTFAPQNPPKADEAGPNPPAAIELPELYPGLQWTSVQKKILVFTSGKRRIDVEGYHLESSPVSSFPQDFISYYIVELKNKDFKETLNSIDPDGLMVTYSKDDLFLTFGIKNIYKGSGDKKQVTGFTAFLEHN